MNEVLQELRNRATAGTESIETCRLLGKAAAEIERLESELAEAREREE